MDDSMLEMQYEDRTYVEDDREEFELNALCQDREHDDDGEDQQNDQDRLDAEEAKNPAES